MIPVNKQTVLLGAGAVLAAAVVLAILSRYGREAGKAAAGAVVDTAAGVVIGAGEAAFGLPDTSDPNVVELGRAALARGEYFEASTHLPAGEFIAGVWARITGSAPQVDAIEATGTLPNPRDAR